MKQKKSASILKKFLIINLTVFSVLGLFTIIYLEAIQPTLVKERSENHKIVINNTKDNLERLNIDYTKEGVRDFLLSTRFLFQSLDRVQFYDLSGNLIGDTNILDLDQSVFTGSDIIFEEALGDEKITPEIEERLEEEEIDEIDENFDLLISNYALSECNRETQMMYIQRFVKKSNKFYIMHNNFHADNGNMSYEEFIDIMDDTHDIEYHGEHGVDENPKVMFGVIK